MFQRIPVKHMQRQVGLGCAIGSEMAGPSRHDGKSQKRVPLCSRKARGLMYLARILARLQLPLVLPGPPHPQAT